MFLSTAEKMRAADRRAIMDYKIPSIALMETASRAVARAAEPYLRGGGSACVLCGSGNNGGDGVGAAVELLRQGHAVRVLLTGSRAHATADFLEMERRLQALGGTVEPFDAAQGLPAGTAVVIDAMFGIGLNKPLEGGARAAVEAVNAAGFPVVAADIPSGVEADTGRILGAAVQATVTVTFSMAKPGHFVEPGCVCTGHLELAGIGIPPEVLQEAATPIRALQDWAVPLPRRDALSHKGDYGRVLLLGGCVGYTGAPSLCARAAVRAGAGLVYLGVPAPIYEITAIKNDEAMPFPLPAEEGGGIAAPAGVDRALRRLETCDVCACGPGLGRGAGARELVRALLTAPEGGRSRPLVLDADALNALAGNLDWLHGRTEPAILTPHAGEFARLGGALTGDRLGDALRFAGAHNCVLLLKGHRCIAAFPDGRAYIATRGNAGMAKGGSGDVLTGILAALLGQFPGKVRRAVCTGMQLHALAGDLCRASLGEYGMTASDLIAALPEAEKQLMEDEKA